MKYRKKCFFGCVFLLVLPAVFFFFSSCGFLMAGGGFNIASSVTGPGDGATPQLASRIAADPKLADKNCSENDRCKETCRDIYEEQTSQKACDKLTVGEVSARENVYHALLDADTKDLEDIEEEDLKAFVKTGLDGWQEVIIGKQKDFLEEKREGNANDPSSSDAYAVFERTLHWIVEQESTVIPILRAEDEDNTILKDLVLSYCDLGDGSHTPDSKKPRYKCRNQNSRHPSNTHINSEIPYSSTTTEPNQNFPVPYYTNGPSPFCFINISTLTPPQTWRNPTTEESTHDHENTANVSIHADKRKFEYPAHNTQNDHRNGIIMSYEKQSLYYCYSNPPPSPPPRTTSGTTTLYHKKLATVSGDNRDLFLSLVGVTDTLFYKAVDENKAEAFSWAHDLLTQACDGSATSLKQCIAVFYCFLSGHIKHHLLQSESGYETINDFLNDDDDDGVEAQIGETELNNCNYKDSFTGL